MNKIVALAALGMALSSFTFGAGYHHHYVRHHWRHHYVRHHYRHHSHALIHIKL